MPEMLWYQKKPGHQQKKHKSSPGSSYKSNISKLEENVLLMLK